MREIIVIGAGPAGLTAASQLSEGGMNVTLLESDSKVGGMARSIELWGQTVDLGPHRFFSMDRQVNALWLKFAGSDYHMVKRLTRIYYNHRFFGYPLRAGNALRNLGIITALACVLSYSRQWGKRADEKLVTFEDWVVRHFGRRLYEIFFKSYSEKLWGKRCDDLDSEFAAQRIKKFSLGEALAKALGFGGKTHKTLVDEFAYPTGGTGMIYERMAENIRKHGGRVLLNTPVAGVMRNGNRVTGVQLQDGSKLRADHVVSTMPLTLLVRSLGDLPHDVSSAVEQLKFRNTILVYLNVDSEHLFPDQWLYIHAPELRCGRITNFRNWVPELHAGEKTSILVLEYWCNMDDAIWAEADGTLVELATRELISTGLTKGDQVLEGQVVRIPRCYPVYHRGYKDQLNQVVRYMAGFENLTAIGRYGSFKYNNQDHSIHMGIQAAENLLHGAENNLWDVNTDYDTYHEACLITETGLELKP